MQKLLAGIREFRKTTRPSYLAKFAHLAHGQAPDCLLVACSDSRVVPNLFASTDPGDLFVVRNVGNLVPLPAPGEGDLSTLAAIEFALYALNVRDIIICGHSSCGAMQALLTGELPKGASVLPGWLDLARPVLPRLPDWPTVGRDLPPEDRLSQINVLEQLAHLSRHPGVVERMAEGRLSLHGWWFDLSAAEVSRYEADEGLFRPIL